MLRACVISMVVAASLMAVGCGSSSDSGDAGEEQVRAVGKVFYESLLDGDYGRACQQFTAAARGQLEALAQASDEVEGANCETILGLISEGAGRKQLEGQLGDPAKWQVTVDGDSATIRTSGDPGSSGTEMVKEDGRWRIGTQPTGSR